MSFRRAVLFAFISALPFAGAACNACAPPVEAGSDVCGEGTINGDDYSIDSKASELVLVVHRKDAFGCGSIHSHVVLAGLATLAYTLDDSAIGDGSIKMTVPASKLQPDAPELRKKYLKANEDPDKVMSDGDISSIKGSISDEVLAEDNPNLIFTVTDLNKATGSGKAKLKSNIAGQDSTVDLNYKVTKSGDDFEVTGDGVIDGTKHGMSRLSLGFCVDENLDVHFKLKFVTGKTTCKATGGTDKFVAKNFPDTGCAADVGFNDARDVLGPRCMGCHQDPPRAGATVPLVTWDDFRIDSSRNRDVALYETAHEYINLAADSSLIMPPQEYTQLDATEKGTLETWMTTEQGRELRCAGDPGPTVFAVTEHVGCAGTPTVAFDLDDGNGNSAQTFFDNNCMYCHGDPVYSSQAPQVGVFDPIAFVTTSYDFDVGGAPGLHPYYADAAGNKQSFWEMGLARAQDGSMPPLSAPGAFEGDPGFAAYQAWVAAGYTELCQ